MLRFYSPKIKLWAPDSFVVASLSKLVIHFFPSIFIYIVGDNCNHCFGGHRDVQASSILLDDKFEVRLGSLSEVHAQEGDANKHVLTRLLRKPQYVFD